MIQCTFVVTMGDDAPEYYHLRAAMLMRKMANVIEAGGMIPPEGFSQGHNYECIKLTKVDPDAS